MSRSPYISLAAFCVPVIASFVTGFYAGLAIASILLAVSFHFDAVGIAPIPWVIIRQTSQTGASIAGLVAFWFVGYQWWFKSERQAREFNQALAAGNIRTHATMDIVHKSEDGRVLSINKGQFTPAQLKLAAEELVNNDWRFNLRMFYHIFGQTRTVEWRTWLLEKEYAELTDGGEVLMTEYGIETLKKLSRSKQKLPSPSVDGYIPFYRDRG